jgi:3'-5' exoribonuclease
MREHPAGKVVHHDFPGGLLEHTIEVISTGLSIMYGEFSPYANRFSSKQIDRFICMALCHDIGKLYELSNEGKYSLWGYAYGHLYISSIMFRNTLEELNISLDTQDEIIITNGILSHHNKLEWGAVKPSVSIEADILHTADMYSMNLSKFIGYAMNPVEVDESGLVVDRNLKRAFYIDNEMKEFTNNKGE